MSRRGAGWGRYGRPRTDTQVAVITVAVRRALGASIAQKRLDRWIVGRESAVHCGIVDRIALVIHIVTTGPAQLTHDLGVGVQNRRAAASALGCTKGIAAVDPFATRPGSAGGSRRVHGVFRVGLGCAARMADSVQVGAAAESHGSIVPTQEYTPRRGIFREAEQRVVTGFVRGDDRRAGRAGIGGQCARPGFTG